jgi:hypothetical protein
MRFGTKYLEAEHIKGKQQKRDPESLASISQMLVKPAALPPSPRFLPTANKKATEEKEANDHCENHSLMLMAYQWSQRSTELGHQVGIDSRAHT